MGDNCVDEITVPEVRRGDNSTEVCKTKVIQFIRGRPQGKRDSQRAMERQSSEKGPSQQSQILLRDQMRQWLETFR